jgi:hypothetical protein
MWTGLRLVTILIGCSLLATSPADSLAEQPRRDRAVVEAVATHLVSVEEFGEPPDSAKRAVVLDARVPRENCPFLCFDNSGSKGHSFSRAEVNALSRRNQSHEPRSWRIACSPCSDWLLVVPDLEKTLSQAADDPSLGKDRFMATWWSNTFERAFPDAKGWIQAFLPGYSADGSEAVFLGSVGPSPHGSVVAAHLHITGNGWVVDRCDIAHFV